MKDYKFILFIFIILFGIFAVAGSETRAYDFKQSSGLEKTAAKTGHTELPVTEDNLPSTIGLFVNIFLSFLGVIFFILMVYGGFIWMMAAGSEEQVTKAKKTIINSIIGLVVVLSAYAVTSLVKTFVINESECSQGESMFCDADNNCQCAPPPPP